MSTDSEIIRRSHDDPELFSELFERHARSVHQYVSRRAGREVADEVLSETFLVGFQQRDRFDLAIDDARPWLLGIATNLLHAHRRKEARHLRVLAKAAPLEITVDEGGFDRIAERSDAARDARRIAARVREMTEGDRDVLLLHAWGDLDSAQIAATLRIPIGTVRSRLFRARRILRASLTHTDKETDSGRTDLAAPA